MKSIIEKKDGITTDEANQFHQLMQKWRFAAMGDDALTAFNSVVAHIDAFGEHRYAQGLNDSVCPDPIVEQNVSLLRNRSFFGVQKYGTTLADNKLTHKQWLRHALEELLDGANYLQAALQQADTPPARYSPYMRGREGQEHASMTTDPNGEWVRLVDVVGIAELPPEVLKPRWSCSECGATTGEQCDLNNCGKANASPFVGMTQQQQDSVTEEVLRDMAGLPTKCKLPPFGWDCTREAGHDGPCAGVAWSAEKHKEEWVKISAALR